MTHNRKIAVIGLGYVGLPVAVAFARSGVPVIGFDIDRQARRGIARRPRPHPRGRAGRSRAADACLRKRSRPRWPTPISTSSPCRRRSTARAGPTSAPCWRRPKTVGGVLKHGDIVVYESTVYPGAVEEDCVPVLEKTSGLDGGRDFTVGYSPERINPGDKTAPLRDHHEGRLGAGCARRSTSSPTSTARSSTAGIHRAPSIKVAEAAKVIENTQRDLNIAFMNELSAIFHQLGIDTGDVLAAAATKWNFLNFQPGLVGGHCIGVDPYYLTYRAEKAGYHPEIILAGRRINDGMGQWVARECVRSLTLRNCTNCVVTVLGMTFKENVPDIRNSKVIDIVRELQRFGMRVQVHDPLAPPEDACTNTASTLTPMRCARARRRGHSGGRASGICQTRAGR